MEIQIIADSCCDLTPTLRRVLRVRMASLTIRVDDGEFIDDENLDIPALMDAMKQSANAPTTACPAPEAYAAMMAQAPMTFVVTLSSRLSGSYNAACVGRDMALEANPSLKICVLDSESASAGETRIPSHRTKRPRRPAAGAPSPPYSDCPAGPHRPHNCARTPRGRLFTPLCLHPRKNV